MTLDWKNWNKGFPYKNGINNPQYKKDRDKLFKEHGNGWWWEWEENKETHVQRMKRLKGRRRKYNERK